MNKTNKTIWEDKFGQVFNASDEENSCVKCYDENGDEIPAVPLGFDDEQKEYDAVRDIIENAIFKKDYKIWKVGSCLKDFVTSEEIDTFDVLYCLDKSWESLLFPVFLYSTDSKNNTVTVKFIDNREDEVITKVITLEHEKDS